MEDYTVYTVEKKQALENPNRFNSIEVSLSYFKVGFSLMGRKRESRHRPFHSCLLPVFFCPFFLYLSWKEMTLVTLFISQTERILHASPSFPPGLPVSHKLQMQMWPFPINSSRQRVSSRTQPQLLFRTKITRGGASVRAQCANTIILTLSRNAQRGDKWEKRIKREGEKKVLSDSSAWPGGGTW